jgi:hypothetical protein
MQDRVNASVPDSTLLVIDQSLLERVQRALTHIRNYYRQDCDCTDCKELKDIENTLELLIVNKGAGKVG